LRALNLIPPFSGLDDESFDIWFSDVRNIILSLDHKKVSTDMVTIAVFNKLRGEAAEIGRRVRASMCYGSSLAIKENEKGKEKEKDEEDVDVKTVFKCVFLDEFKREFNSPAQAIKWMSKLDNLKQNGVDVVKYANLVIALSRRVNPNVSEHEIVVCIIKGLDDHFRQRISAIPLSSVGSVIASLTNIQNIDVYNSY